jgi:uncharacterized membrane protein YhhN
MNLIHKDKRILSLLILLVVLYIAFIYLDIVSECLLLCKVLKYAADAVCFLIAVLTYRYSFRRDDAGLLILALFFTLIADALFLFAYAFTSGIVCFYFVHLCYIRRYKKKSFIRNFVLALAVIAFCTVGFIAGLKLPYVPLLGVVYAVLIVTATGLAFRSNLPQVNKRLAEVGMILFLLCDTNVALSFFASKFGQFNQIISTLVWVFYTPSQLFLSLSAVDYNRAGLDVYPPESKSNDL